MSAVLAASPWTRTPEKMIHTPERVRFQVWHRHGIQPTDPIESHEDWNFIGFDTETVRGLPYSFQIFSRFGVSSFVRCDRETILARFYDALIDWADDPKKLWLVWAHNLEFDLGVLLSRYPHAWKTRGSRDDVEFTTVEEKSQHRLDWWLLTHKPIQATLRLPNGARVKFLDTSSFFEAEREFGHVKLSDLCKQLGVPVQKLKPPKYLGVREPKPSEVSYFRRYAMVDAQAVEQIAGLILEKHSEYGVRLSVSGPNLAEKVFRTHFLKNTIPPPEFETQQVSLRSYHGGRNGFYVKPGLYAPVVELDYASAYPWAMTMLPPVDIGEWKRAKWRQGERVRLDAVYHVRGNHQSVLRPMFWRTKKGSPSGTKKGELHRPGPGEWYVTGWELESAIKSGEIQNAYGFARWFDSTPEAVEHFRVGCKLSFQNRYGGETAEISDAALSDYEKLLRCEPDSPFVRYAEHFFELKRKTPKSHPNYTFYKVCLLNSLYGKLFQRIPTRTQRIIYWAAANAMELMGGESRAGGMFHPFLASLVTGRVRAGLHDLGVEYGSLHESTDSLHVMGDAYERMKSAGLLGDGLGQLEKKVEGPCLFLRSKLYVHWDMDGKLKKVAFHGFQGGTARLLRMWKLGLYHYEHRHMNKPKETLRSGEQPFDMVTKEKFLDVDWPEFTDTVKVGDKTIRLEMPEPKPLRA